MDFIHGGYAKERNPKMNALNDNAVLVENQNVLDFDENKSALNLNADNRKSLLQYKESETVDFIQAAKLVHSTLADFKTDLNKINNFLGVSIENVENGTLKIKDLTFFLQIRNLARRVKISKERDYEKNYKKKALLNKLEKAVTKFQKEYGKKEFYPIADIVNFFGLKHQNFYTYIKKGRFEYIGTPEGKNLEIKLQSFVDFQINKIKNFSTDKKFQCKILKDKK